MLSEAESLRLPIIPWYSPLLNEKPLPAFHDVHPREEWVTDGAQTCPYCLTTSRLTAYTMQQARTRACHRCIWSQGLGRVAREACVRLLQAVEKGWSPQDAKLRSGLQGMSIQGMVGGIQVSIDARYYRTATEIRAREGGEYREAYIRRNGMAGTMMLDPTLPEEYRPSPWLAVILEGVFG